MNTAISYPAWSWWREAQPARLGALLALGSAALAILGEANSHWRQLHLGDGWCDDAMHAYFGTVLVRACIVPLLTPAMLVNLSGGGLIAAQHKWLPQYRAVKHVAAALAHGILLWWNWCLLWKYC